MPRIMISAAARDAMLAHPAAASVSNAFHDLQPHKDGWSFSASAETVRRLQAKRLPGETLSDVILRVCVMTSKGREGLN